MDDFFSSNLFAALVIGAVSVALLKLLIAVYRRHRQDGSHEKLEIAIELFDGDEAAAKVWLSTPVKSLGQRRPRDVTTEEVRTLVERISHGVIT